MRERSDALRARAATERERFEERYGSTRTFGIAHGVHRRDRAVAGGELAAALAYRLFLWFLPLVLVLVAGLGVYAESQHERPQEVADRLGLAGLVVASVGEAAQSEARWYALLIGIPILLYLTRTLLRTVVVVHRLAWSLEPARGHMTPKNVLLFLVALVAILSVGAVVSATAEHSARWWLAVVPLAVLARGAVWLAISSRLPRAESPWTALLPGAVVVGVGFFGVNLFTMIAVEQIANAREDAYGSFGVAATVLFSLWVASRVVVVSAVTNAELWSRKSRHAP
jgi:membrane protein